MFDQLLYLYNSYILTLLFGMAQPRSLSKGAANHSLGNLTEQCFLFKKLLFHKCYCLTSAFFEVHNANSFFAKRCIKNREHILVLLRTLYHLRVSSFLKTIRKWKITPSEIRPILSSEIKYSFSTMKQAPLK